MVVVVANDAEWWGWMWLRSGGDAWRVTGEFRAIEPRVVDEDGQGHIVLWWGRASAEGQWGDRAIVNTIVDLDFDDLPPARALVIRMDGPDERVNTGRTDAWMYGLDGTPWPMQPPDGRGGVREPRRPLPTGSAGHLPDPEDLPD